MSILTVPFFTVLVLDPVIISLAESYNGEPAVFTIDPVPGDADYPLLVTAGEVAVAPNDCKNSQGIAFIRDVRCYADADGSVDIIEELADRVRFLFHRQPLSIPGYNWVMSSVTGPIVADEPDYYGRICSVSVLVREDLNLS